MRENLLRQHPFFMPNADAPASKFESAARQLALAVVVIVAGCSAAGTTDSGPSILPVAQRTSNAPEPTAAFKGLYVADLSAKQGQGGVFMLARPKYQSVGKITKGMYLADGLWLDTAGNLYAANADGGNVTEYAPGRKSPKCTYTGATDPTNVKTDDAGEVFVMDWHDGSEGAIDVYKQCQDNIIRRYTFGGGSRTGTPSDVAFDSRGDMFVLYLKYESGQPVDGALEEYKAHSKTPTQLGATVSFPGALLIDKHQNLIAVDQGNQSETNGAIDIIAPPYATATPLVSNLTQPVFLSLDRREDLLFADSFDFNTPTVWVFDYPSGKLKMKLGTQNGLEYPLGVAAAF